ncbi:hypothetical protein H0H93_012695, partial [Arthromyces matolae]
DQRIIDSLPRARHANFRAEKHDQCLPGTRIVILNELEAWAHDPSAKRVFWLNGHAGSGKSTIAQSFCRQAFSDGKLGASFFCSRDSEARSDLDMIFPTLAFQLACQFPGISPHIVKNLKTRPDVAHESLNAQLEKLIIEPLEQQSSLSILIAIDALDECKDTHPSSIILHLLSLHIHRVPHVKWFITGRPEPPIRQGFRTFDEKELTKTLVLQDVSPSDIKHDISLYLSTRLSDVGKNRSGLDLPSIWPTDNEIEDLTVKCNGLFIFASTAVRYISSPINTPDVILSRLCHESSSPEQGAFGLDKLYTDVLERGYLNAPREFKTILGAIVLAVTPIPVDDLAILLNLKAKIITDRLRMLHAILRVPHSNDSPVLMYHKSFFDYITNNSRCTNSEFYLNPSIEHGALAYHCLRMMNRNLKRNPCSLPRYAMNDDELELSEREGLVGGALV